MTGLPLCRAALAVAVVPMTFLAGCNSEPSHEVRVFGFLMTDGEPVEHGYLALMPLGDGAPTVVQTDGEGRFDARCALCDRTAGEKKERYQVAYIRSAFSTEVEPEHLRDHALVYRVEPTIICIEGSEKDFALELVAEEQATNSTQIAGKPVDSNRRG